jgi:hypothetical protein
MGITAAMQALPGWQVLIVTSELERVHGITTAPCAFHLYSGIDYRCTWRRNLSLRALIACERHSQSVLSRLLPNVPNFISHHRY